MDSSGLEQIKDAHQADPPGRLVVRGTKSLTVPNWDGAACSIQPSRHEDNRPRTGDDLERICLNMTEREPERVREERDRGSNHVCRCSDAEKEKSK